MCTKLDGQQKNINKLCRKQAERNKKWQRDHFLLHSFFEHPLNMLTLLVEDLKRIGTEIYGGMNQITTNTKW